MPPDTRSSLQEQLERIRAPLKDPSGAPLKPSVGQNERPVPDVTASPSLIEPRERQLQTSEDSPLTITRPSESPIARSKDHLVRMAAPAPAPAPAPAFVPVPTPAATSEPNRDRDGSSKIPVIPGGAAATPDLEVLVDLEAALGARERELGAATEGLARDRLDHLLAVQQLARDREALEETQAALDSRERCVDDRVTSLASREANLSDKQKKVTADACASKLLAGQLTRQEKQQASKEAELGSREIRVEARESKVQSAIALHRKTSKELRAANLKVDDLEKQVVQRTRDRNRLQRKIDDASAVVPAAFQIATWDIAQWMLGSLEVDFEDFAERVAFSGDGPFRRSDMEVAARAQGLQVGRCGARQAAKVLIVGRTGFDQRAIQAHIDALADEELFVFPQELWVAALLIGYNPFRYLEDATCRSSVEAFGHGHPVIEWLRGEQSPWPEWETDQGDPGSGFDQKVNVSPLVKLEYRVGKINGLPSVARRGILSDALSAAALPVADFEKGVPLSIQREYMTSWGTPSSRIRLRRIAWHLAMLITMHARLRNHDVAVREWQDDLAWLRKNFYSTLMRFQWP